MPELSLFKPLCDILGITINELMSGEPISNKEYNKKLEENIINTINYIDKKEIKNNDLKSILLLLIGIIGIFISQFIIKDLETQSYINIICMILAIHALKRLFLKYKLARKIITILLIIICIITLMLY